MATSDPALDRPRLKTDMCRNVDLPLGAFAINHLVSWIFFPTFPWVTPPCIRILFCLELFILYSSFFLPHTFPFVGFSFAFFLFSTPFTVRIPSQAHVHSRLLKRHMHGITGIHRPKTVHPCGKPTFIALSSITRVKCKRFTGWRSPYIRKPSLPPYGTYSPSPAFLISV